MLRPHFDSSLLPLLGRGCRTFQTSAGDLLLTSTRHAGRDVVLVPRGHGSPLHGRVVAGQLIDLRSGVTCSPARWESAGAVIAHLRAVEALRPATVSPDLVWCEDGFTLLRIGEPDGGPDRVLDAVQHVRPSARRLGANIWIDGMPEQGLRGLTHLRELLWQRSGVALRPLRGSDRGALARLSRHLPDGFVGAVHPLLEKRLGPPTYGSLPAYGHWSGPGIPDVEGVLSLVAGLSAPIGAAEVQLETDRGPMRVQATGASLVQALRVALGPGARVSSVVVSAVGRRQLALWA